MKKILSAVLAIAMLLSSVGVFAARDVAVILNGKELYLKNAVTVRDGEAFLPLDEICAALSLESDGTKVTNGSTVTEFAEGETEAVKGNMTVSLSSAPFTENGVFYLPLSALDVLGAYKTSFDEAAGKVNIVYNKLDGKYFNIIQASTGKVFSLLDGGLGDGVRVIVETATGSDIQIWKFTQKGDNTYDPTNLKSLRSFDIPNGRSDLGLELIQYGITDSTNQWIVPRENPDGTYYLQCKHSNLFLTVDENGFVSQNAFTGDDSQRYYLAEIPVSAPEVPTVSGAAVPEAPNDKDGKFFTFIHDSSNLALSVSGASLGDGAEVTLEEVSTSDFQVWKLTQRGNNSYEITNKASSLALALPNEVPAVGDKVVQKEPVYDGGMIFRLSEKDGLYRVQNTASSLYLTLKDGALCYDELLPGYSQLFRLEEPVCDAANHERDPLGGRYYTIGNSKGVVSVEADSVNNGARIVCSPEGAASSEWAFVTQGGGRYVIMNKLSSRSFDIPSASTLPGAWLTQYDTNYGGNQLFEPVLSSDGTYLIKNENSSLYLTVGSDGYLTQQRLTDDASQHFTLTETGASDMKMIGAAATLFLLKGEDKVTNAKLQWNSVPGADTYDVYRSVDNGDFEFLTSLSGTTVDDYDLEVGKSYTYRVYALEDAKLIDFAETEPVVPYDLPSDLKSSSNLSPSSLDRPNSLYVDGTYYSFSSWGREDGNGFGRLMMYTSKDDITYEGPVEVLNYEEILANETCENFTSCRFESQNFLYNPVANKFVFIAHFEADGGYGTAMTSFATASPGERFTFHAAIRPNDDDTRDLNVYVDDDNCAYLIAAVHNNADLALYKLNEDWSGVEKKLCNVNSGKWRELPSMLKVDGRYYLFSSGTAGWYPTQGMYNTATSIEGPWSELRIVGNTTTFSSQSGTVSRLKDGSENYIMSTYRWMYFWADSIERLTTNRRYPLKVSNGYAFYDFFEELLYNWDNDVLVPVQNGRILSQGKPSVTSTAPENARYANDGNYQSVWTGETEWPYTWEVDLGENHKLSQMQVSWLIWNGSEPYYHYKVEASVDGKNYTTILDKTEGFTDYGFTVDSLSGAARYVRLTVTGAKPRSSNENPYPSQLYEVKILGE